MNPQSRPRGFGQPHQVQELGAVAERIIAARALRQRQNVVVTITLRVRRALDQLAERRDGNRETLLGRYFRRTAFHERTCHRHRDQLGKLER